jgi:hypothetical protein
MLTMLTADQIHVSRPDLPKEVDLDHVISICLDAHAGIIYLLTSSILHQVHYV